MNVSMKGVNRKWTSAGSRRKTWTEIEYLKWNWNGPLLKRLKWLEAVRRVLETGRVGEIIGPEVSSKDKVDERLNWK